MSFEDLPLFPEAEPGPGEEGRRRPPGGAEARERPSTPGMQPVAGSHRDPLQPRTSPPSGSVTGPRWRAARFSERIEAGVADCLALGAATVIVALGASLAGARLAADRWPPLILFLVAFSFAYTAVPLAFWGQTPGMAVLALVARRPGQAPLTFRQAVVRWLAGWVTVLLAGVPALLALSGASLADRLSGSATLRKLA